MKDSRLKSLLPYLTIIVVGFLLYLPTLFFGFTYLDDNTLILDNSGFLSNISNIFEAFRQEVFHILHSSAAYYRPILTVSFMLDAQLGGVNPFIYHLSNILIHLLACCLLYLFFVKLKYRRELAWFFALLFAVHPVLAQAVAWIPGRNDSLLTVFVLLSFISFSNYVEQKKWWDYGWHLLFFALALFTKENALILIALCGLYLQTIVKERFFSARERKLLVGWGVVAVGWFLLRQAALVNPLQYSLPEIGRMMVFNSPVIVQLLGKALFPFNLSVLPVMRDTTFISGLAAAVLLAVLIWRTKNRRGNYLLFGFAWFTLFVIPTVFSLNPTQDFGSYYQLEHRIYLPLIGIIIMLLETGLIRDLDLKRKGVLAILAGSLILFAGLNYSHTKNFSDRISFWENAVKTSPHSPLAHRNLGAMYYLAGSPDKAEPEYLKSAELNSAEPMVHNNLGLIYMNRGKLKAAELEFARELAINPNYDNALFNLGLLYARQGKIREAAALWQRTLEINPEYGDARKYLELIRAR
jgi:protein O-mannosyl-transferase